jgi:hypothetical protein
MDGGGPAYWTGIASWLAARAWADNGATTAILTTSCWSTPSFDLIDS